MILCGDHFILTATSGGSRCTEMVSRKHTVLQYASFKVMIDVFGAAKKGRNINGCMSVWHTKNGQICQETSANISSNQSQVKKK